jgi:putative FmdB family regulatory protein
MPTYDYLCEHCNHQFEYFQSMSDEPLKSCPECGKSVRRLIGGGLGVIFKGNGFYVNDSKGKKNPTLDSGNNKGTAAASADSKTSTESKNSKSGDSGSSTKSDKPSEKPKVSAGS